MATISDTPMWVEGCLTAGNILAGRYTFSSVSANTAKESVSITTGFMSGTGRVYPQVTAHCGAEGVAGKGAETGIRMVTVAFPATDGESFNIWLYQSTTANTTVFYLVTRSP